MGPRFLEIELTARCQLHCRHCYRNSPAAGDLPAEKVKEIIDQAPEFFDCLIFSGGEPFLHPDLADLVTYADTRNYSVHLTTSGYHLPQETLHHLPGNVVLVFGIDGIGKIHDAYRGRPGAYDEVLDTMASCHGKPMEIITTLWKGALPHVGSIARLAAEHGAGLHYNALIPAGRALLNPDILLTPEEHEWVHQQIAALKRAYPFIMTDQYKVSEKDREHGIDLFCKGRFSIDPHGNVHPCEFLTWITFGNIFQEDLPAIIRAALDTPLIQAREQGFKQHIRPDIPDPFDYHTHICHVLTGTLRSPIIAGCRTTTEPSP